ncbi:HD domain-containing protein [Ktedonosporobacter rubrisoli]|uniref:HD domain-containing protein n=1 Tax=Ktedonosporobacter rubrisoli TaxID=2509675 RepID=A0A4P6K467_KTERU|nr:HD domain-containing protein [Ktedonosporobacter rubrisoli]QBD82723.1 HD domain-containing protein [Ktedonosporobacter rubrisoli]
MQDTLTELRSWLLRLAKETFEREESKDAAHDYDHIVRTMALADTIQRHEGGDLPTIWAAVAFHDVGQTRERQHGGDHAQISAAMAADLLMHTAFPQHAIPAVQQAIRDHRLTGGTRPQSLEGCILYDADKIDTLGAIGIGRLYSITGHYNQKIYSPLPADVSEPVDLLTIRKLRRRPDYSPSIEFQLLFIDLPERMTTATGKHLARERYDYMAEFFKRLEKEVKGEL